MSKAKKFLSLGALLSFGVVLGVAALLWYANSAHAALTIENVGGSLGLGSADLKQTVMNIVKWALGLLGLVAVIVMLYGGFLWLTARGKEDQIDKAKRTIINGVIGLVIILIAWAIVLFIQRFITGATGAGAASCTIGTVNGCVTCVQNPTQPSGEGWWIDNGSCLPPVTSYIWEPTGQVPIIGETDVELCKLPSETFGGLPVPADNTPSAGTYTVEEMTAGCLAPTGTTMSGTTLLGPTNTASFLHTADFVQNTCYRITHNIFMSSGATPVPLTLPPTSWTFTTGTKSDVLPPTVTATDPVNASAVDCLKPNISVAFSETMFPPSIVPENITVTPLPTSGAKVTFISVWPTQDGFSASFDKPLDKNTTYTITLNADIDKTTKTSGAGYNYISGFKDSCFNALDGDADTNAEGTPIDDYSWTFSIGNTTQQECNPEITSVSTPTYYGNNYAGAQQPVTIVGKNFGLNGTVFFTGTAATAFKSATPGVQNHCFNPTFRPQQTTSPSCVENVVASWQPSQITTLLPAGLTPSANPAGPPTGGASNGPVFVQTTINSPPSTPITVNSPHIDWVSPPDGKPGTFVTIAGSHFGNTPGQILFRQADGTEVTGTIPACAGASGWADNQIIAQVPTGFGNPEIVDIQIRHATLAQPLGRSNLFRFTVNDVERPGLCKIVPDCHASGGGMLTAYGEGFGTVIGDISSLYIPPSSGAINGTQSNLQSAIGTVDVTAPGGLPNNQYLFQLTIGTNSTNALNYKIPCGDTPEVKIDASCNPPSFISSPSPLPNAEGMCRNSVMRAEFTVDMDTLTFDTTNFKLDECADDAAFNDSTCTHPVAGTVNTISNRIMQFSVPSATLQSKYWYRATIKKGVKNTFGTNMNADFAWHFRIRDSDEDCTADTVAVAPSLLTMVTGQSQDFTASAMMNNCNIIISPTAFTWNIFNPGLLGLIQYAGGMNDIAQVMSIPGGSEDDWASLNATVDSKTGTAVVNVSRNYCEKDLDCTPGGTCTGSTCDLASHRCTPVVTGINPPTGAAGNVLSVHGCYFGDSKGDGNVQFDDDFSGGTSPYDGDFSICGPSSWTPSLITVGHTPKNAGSGTNWYVQVKTNSSQGGFTSPVSGVSYGVSAQCLDQNGTGVPIPTNGAPILCGITPNAAKATQPITYSGKQFSAFNDNKIYFQKSSAWGEALSSGSSFTTTEGRDIQAGNDVDTPGLTAVGVPSSGSYCLSNDQNFTLSCDQNNECASSCCKANICQPDLGACTDNLIKEVLPSNIDPLVCRNVAFTIIFMKPMRTDTLTAANIYLNDIAANKIVPTSIQIKGDTIVDLIPAAPLDANGAYDVVVKGTKDGVVAKDNTFMTDDYFKGYAVDPDATVCKVDHVSIAKLTLSPPPPDDKLITEDLFTCFGDTCPPAEDIEPMPTAGNQHGYFSRVYSASGEELVASSQEWKPADTGPTASATNVYDSDVTSPLCRGSATGPGQLYCATSKNFPSGSELLTVKTIAAFGAGSGTATIPIRTFLCANPWPIPPVSFPFVDTAPAQNFELSFCRDGMDKFTLRQINSGIKDPDSELLKEYMFMVQKWDGTDYKNIGDAIGLRVYINPNELSPEHWYSVKQGKAPSGSATTIDGYPALREGRTVYITATNLGVDPSGNDVLYSNVFVISHTDNSSSETVQIFEKLLQNIKFNINIPANDKLAIQKDTVRLHNMWEMVYALEAAKISKGIYPKLETGSYLKGISNSHWPSWSGAFTQELGSSPPKDVEDTWDAAQVALNCPAIDGFEAATCWSEKGKKFVFPFDPALPNPPASKGILYAANNTAIFGTMDYVANPRDSASIVSILNLLDRAPGGTILQMDPCAAVLPANNSTCKGFNFMINNSDFASIKSKLIHAAQDTKAPTVAILAPPAGGISGTVEFKVEAHDNPDGVGMADVAFEFRNSVGGGWSKTVATTYAPGRYRVIFNTRTIENGDYELRVIGRDRANNKSGAEKRTYNVRNTASGPDTQAPLITLIDPNAVGSPLAKGSAYVLRASADDTLRGGSGVARMWYEISFNPSDDFRNVGDATPSGCPAFCPLVYEGDVNLSSTFLNTFSVGNHTLRVHAIDAKGNETSTDLVISVINGPGYDSPPVLSNFYPFVDNTHVTAGNIIHLHVEATDDNGITNLSLILIDWSTFTTITFSEGRPYTTVTKSPDNKHWVLDTAWPAVAGSYDTAVFQALDNKAPTSQVASYSIDNFIVDPANQPPKISNFVPANGASLPAGPITVKADLTDDHGLQNATMTITNLDTASAIYNFAYPLSGTSWSLDIPGVTLAANTLGYNFNLQVRDTGGLVTTSNHVITITPAASNLPPVVTFIEPANPSYTVGTAVPVRIHVTDDAASILSTVFFTGMTGYSGTWTKDVTTTRDWTVYLASSWTPPAVGTYTLTAGAQDSLGLVGTKTITFTVTSAAGPSPYIAAGFTPSIGQSFTSGTPITFTYNIFDPDPLTTLQHFDFSPCNAANIMFSPASSSLDMTDPNHWIANMTYNLVSGIYHIPIRLDNTAGTPGAPPPISYNHGVSCADPTNYEIQVKSAGPNKPPVVKSDYSPKPGQVFASGSAVNFWFDVSDPDNNLNHFMIVVKDSVGTQIAGSISKGTLTMINTFHWTWSYQPILPAGTYTVNIPPPPVGDSGIDDALGLQYIPPPPHSYTFTVTP